MSDMDKARRVWTQIRSDTVESDTDPDGPERENLHRPRALKRIAAALAEAREEGRREGSAYTLEMLFTYCDEQGLPKSKEFLQTFLGTFKDTPDAH